MEFLSEVLDLCVELLGEVFVQWIQNLPGQPRLYIGAISVSCGDWGQGGGSCSTALGAGLG